MTKLKPCPFCGRKLAEQKDLFLGGTIHYHENKDCILSRKMEAIPEEVFVRLWNTRAPDPRLKKAIEEIESILQLKADSAIQGEFTDGFDSGLRRAVYLVKKCIPEVKDG